MSATAEIMVAIKGDISQLQGAFAKGKQEAKGFAGEIEGVGKRISSAWGSALLTYFGLEKIKMAVRELFAEAERTVTSARAAGLLTAEYVELRNRAESAGMSVAELNKRVGEWSSGKRAFSDIIDGLTTLDELTIGGAAKVESAAMRAADRAEKIYTQFRRNNQRGFAVGVVSYASTVGAGLGSQSGAANLLEMAGGDIDEAMRIYSMAGGLSGLFASRARRTMEQAIASGAYKPEERAPVYDYRDQDFVGPMQEEIMGPFMPFSERDKREQEAERERERAEKAAERRQSRVADLAERRDSRLASMTVDMPQSAGALAIGGYFTGQGGLNNEIVMQIRRSNEEQKAIADYVRELARIMSGDE